MSYPLLAKGSLGVLGLGTVAGAVYFGKDLIGRKDSQDKKKKTSIKELIRSSNPHKRLISGNTVTDQYGKDAWQKYRKAHLDKDSNIGNLEGGTRPTGSIENSDSASSHFINACSSKADVEVENDKDPLYVQVVSYCTRDALISDLIAEKNPSKSLLSKDSGDNEKGKSPGEAYKQANSDKDQGRDKWQLSDWKQKHNDNDAPVSFKDECKKRFDSKTETASVGDYLNVLNWCTK